MFEVFYDGECPLCMREIRMLRRMDRRGRIRFTDIAVPGFDATPIGVDKAALMARIHGRLPSGELVEGVEVLRQLYAAIGLKPLVAVSRLPGVSHALDAAYGWFARNRLHITGRCTPESCSIEHKPG